MTIAAGKIAYSLGAVPVTGCGLAWDDGELAAALAGQVSEVVFDDSGKADIAALLSGVIGTDFEKDGMDQEQSI